MKRSALGKSLEKAGKAEQADEKTKRSSRWVVQQSGESVETTNLEIDRFRCQCAVSTLSTGFHFEFKLGAGHMQFTRIAWARFTLTIRVERHRISQARSNQNIGVACGGENGQENGIASFLISVSWKPPANYPCEIQRVLT